MIRLVVLGSSASMPSRERVPSCFAVKYDGVFLFDCCEGCQRQMMKYGVSFAQVKCVFLTHLHADHFLGLLGLVQSMNFVGRKDPLYIFGPAGTQKLFETLFYLRELRPGFNVRVFDVGESPKPVFESRLFSVRAFEVEHTGKALGFALEEKPLRKFDLQKTEKLGVPRSLFTELQNKETVKIKNEKTSRAKTVKLEQVTFLKPGKKIVYSGDTRPCKTLLQEARNADLLVHDACFTEEQRQLAEEKKHSTAREAAETARKAGAKKLLLTHFSNRYDDRKPLLEEAKAVFGESLAAEEGLELMV
ncbi:MAG: ribonuclease Z [Candidatus Micrarchaeota archaeon]